MFLRGGLSRVWVRVKGVRSRHGVYNRVGAPREKIMWERFLLECIIISISLSMLPLTIILATLFLISSSSFSFIYFSFFSYPYMHAWIYVYRWTSANMYVCTCTCRYEIFVGDRGAVTPSRTIDLSNRFHHPATLQLLSIYIILAWV